MTMGRMFSSWDTLGKGDEIQVLDEEVVIASGSDEDFTNDREILWLVSSFAVGRSTSHRIYGGGRLMFHRVDGWDIRIASADQSS